MVIRSFPVPFAGNGYSNDCVTHILPLASKAIFIGLPISGSEANKLISKPGGSLKPNRSSSGVLGSVERTCLLNSSPRSEEHTSELQSLMRISYAVFCLKKKKIKIQYNALSCETRIATTHNL